MGQIAEDMIDGLCCEICGQYFEHPNDAIYAHGYPATCWKCWKDLNKDEKNNRIKADVKTF